MANALLDVVNTFNTLDQQYNLLRAACKPGPDPTQPSPDLVALDDKYSTAQDNCYAVAGKTLEDDDPEIATLSKQLKDANTEVAKSVTEMGNMSKVLDGLTQAITIGSQLIAKIP